MSGNPVVSKGLPGHVSDLVGECGRKLRVSGETKGRCWGGREKLRTWLKCVYIAPGYGSSYKLSDGTVRKD